MDTEDFLASLETYENGTPDTYFNFRVVTQKYGKGIVQYGMSKKLLSIQVVILVLVEDTTISVMSQVKSI